MQLLQTLIISDLAMYLFAVLGLLLLWQFHQIQVLNGRIYAVDFWDISGIRILFHISMLDTQACRTCRQAHGTAFLPSLATKKDFSSLEHPCSSPEGCRCLIVGLYGGWPEANNLIKFLRKHGKKQAIKLEHQQVEELLKGPWQKSVSAAEDRLTLYMLDGIFKEKKNPAESIQHYRQVINEASGARDLRLLVPAFLRLSELLEKSNQFHESLAITKQFEHRFLKHKKIFYYPSAEQRWVMAVRKSRIIKRLKMPTSRNQYHNIDSPRISPSTA